MKQKMIKTWNILGILLTLSAIILTIAYISISSNISNLKYEIIVIIILALSIIIKIKRYTKRLNKKEDKQKVENSESKIN